jgi:hypothetical protein
LVCALVLLTCALLVRPFVEIGVSDDFSYARSAQLLAQTGHIVYNGFANPILGWQLYLGALFIKLFGFSFTSLRISMLALSCVTAYLLHRVMMNFGLSAWNATLGTLTVMLSPVWLVLTVVFMTDVPGLFSILLCTYACQRAILSRSDETALAWLCFAGLTNIVGGTARQIAWLGVLIIVPSTAWLLRRRKGMFASGVVLWIVGILSIEACLHWFLRQPYSLPEKLINGPIGFSRLGNILRTILRILPSLPLIALPVMMLFPFGLRDLSRRARTRTVLTICVASAICLALTFALLDRGFRPVKFLPPWLGYDWTIYGVMQTPGGEIAGHNAVVLLPAYQVLLMLGVVVTAICLGAHLLLRVRSGEEKMQHGHAACLTWKETWTLLLPFAAAYFALLLPRATESVAFDRYVMPLAIVLIIVLLRYAQDTFAYPAYWLSAFTLFLFTAYAVAGTHDRFAFERARLAAAREVTDSGIPRTSLEGGFEYDGWTQITTEGYIDDPRLLHGYHAFKREPALPCHDSFFSLVPAVQPKYQLAFTPQGCFSPSSFAPVTFHTWMPPFTRQVYIQKID